ncbi:MAG: hypothetical protein N2C14_17490, partial [Planctomycetales bacterium]
MNDHCPGVRLFDRSPRTVRVPSTIILLRVWPMASDFVKRSAPRKTASGKHNGPLEVIIAWVSR